MENIRRNIKIFFAMYGSLLFRIIGIIAIVIFILHEINYLYKEKNEEKIEENSILQEEKIKNEEELREQKEEIQVISEFIDYCNNNQIELAYNMLSEKCINEKYQTLEKFKKEYVDNLFTYKKEYKIEKENDLYKVKIIDGALQSGSTENRKSIINYYKIEDAVLERTIYIER